MSEDESAPDSQKSRQELLDEIYYLRDVAGQREQQVRMLQARIERTLSNRIWRWTAPVRRLARPLRRARMTYSQEPSLRSKIETLRGASRNAGERHLYVDVTALVLHGGMTGVQRVTREIATSLLSSPPAGLTVQPVYAAPGQPYRVLSARHSREGGNPVSSSADSSKPLHLGTQGSGCDYSGTSALMNARAGDVFLGLDHALQAIVERERDLDSMRQRGVRLWFVCNDTLPLDHPEWFPPEVAPRFEAWLRAVLRIADGVACISQTTQAQVSRWLATWNIGRDQPLKLGHFALGAAPRVHVGETTTTDEGSVLLERLHGKTAFLMVGTLEPRKGHAQALEAFNRLWASGEDILLVIVGLPGWMTEVTQRRIRHHEEFDRRLFWFMNASDVLLEKLYTTCTVLLAPSEGEGFGLPLIEAARHDLPILCRELPVFREVAVDFATYFSGSDAESLSGAIDRWLLARQQGRVPSTATMPRLTWAESAQQLIHVVLGDRRRAPASASRQVQQ